MPYVLHSIWLIAMALGDRLRLARERQGLTLRELANQASIDFSLLAKYERGIHRPRPATVAQISKILNCTAAELLTEEPPPSLRRYATQPAAPIPESGPKISPRQMRLLRELNDLGIETTEELLRAVADEEQLSLLSKLERSGIRNEEDWERLLARIDRLIEYLPLPLEAFEALLDISKVSRKR